MIESRIQILALLVLLLAGCSKENPIDKYKYWQGAGDSGETVERDKTTVEIKDNGIYDEWDTYDWLSSGRYT